MGKRKPASKTAPLATAAAADEEEEREEAVAVEAGGEDPVNPVDLATVHALEVERDTLRGDHEEALAAIRELRMANTSLQAQVRDLSSSVEEAIAKKSSAAASGKGYVRDGKGKERE